MVWLSRVCLSPWFGISGGMVNLSPWFGISGGMVISLVIQQIFSPTQNSTILSSTRINSTSLSFVGAGDSVSCHTKRETTDPQFPMLTEHFKINCNIYSVKVFNFCKKPIPNVPAGNHKFGDTLIRTSCDVRKDETKLECYLLHSFSTELVSYARGYILHPHIVPGCSTGHHQQPGNRQSCDFLSRPGHSAHQ